MNTDIMIVNHFPTNRAIGKYAEQLTRLSCYNFRILSVDFRPNENRIFPYGDVIKGSPSIYLNVAFRNIVYRNAINQIRETIRSGGIIHYADQSSPAFSERSEREIVTFHDLFPLGKVDGGNSFASTFYKRWTLKFFSFHNAIAVSNFTKESLREAGFQGNIFVVHHSVREAFFPMRNKKMLREKYHIPNDKIVLISNSTDLPRKNLAFQALAVDGLGDGYILIRIGPQVGKRSVSFTNVTDVELSELYNLSDCFILTSTHEGFNHPVTEAMSCGLPVVVPDIPVMREVVDTAGIFFQLDDVKSFHEAVKNAILNSDLYSNYSRERSKAFSQHNFEQQMCNVYSKIK